METVELVNPELIESTLKSAKEALKFLREKKKKTKNDLLSIEYLRTFVNNPTPINYIFLLVYYT